VTRVLEDVALQAPEPGKRLTGRNLRAALDSTHLTVIRTTRPVGAGFRSLASEDANADIEPPMDSLSKLASTADRRRKLH
jgi:hypothetical protein